MIQALQSATEDMICVPCGTSRRLRTGGPFLWQWSPVAVEHYYTMMKYSEFSQILPQRQRRWVFQPTIVVLLEALLDCASMDLFPAVGRGPLAEA